VLGNIPLTDPLHPTRKKYKVDLKKIVGLEPHKADEADDSIVISSFKYLSRIFHPGSVLLGI